MDVDYYYHHHHFRQRRPDRGDPGLLTLIGNHHFRLIQAVHFHGTAERGYTQKQPSEDGYADGDRIIEATHAV